MTPFVDKNHDTLQSMLRAYRYATNEVVIDGHLQRLDKMVPNATMPWHRSKLLARIAAKIEAPNCLELGTNAGFTTARIAAACPNGKLITIDGQRSMLDMARARCESLGLHNITYIHGLFSEVLKPLCADYPPFDLVLIDGDHCEEATLGYLVILRTAMRPCSVIVLDDINHSAQMKRCWQRVKKLDWITATVEFKKIGICIIDRNVTNLPACHLRLPWFMHRLV